MAWFFKTMHCSKCKDFRTHLHNLDNNKYVCAECQTSFTLGDKIK